jgi:replication initiation protein RepC
MEQEHCAREAPQGSFAHKPTGFRRLTPGLLKADHSAEAFKGLPEGVESPGQLLAAFKAAAPRLGISPRLVHTVDWLFCFTEPQDWELGQRPIVWPSSSRQQEALGLSERQTKRLNRALIELGLVTMKDSPTGKRYGKRHEKTGRIIEAYGFDLSPIAARHAEFVRLAEEAKAERIAMGRLRRRATIARKGIAQILETVEEYGFEGEEWHSLAREAADIVRALRAVERPDEMEAGVKSLERRQTAARERLETLLQIVEMSPSGVKNDTPIYNYNSTLNPEQDTVIAAEKSSGAGGTAVPQSSAPGLRQQSERDTGSDIEPDEKVSSIRPDELVRLAPKLKAYLRHPEPAWPDIVEAADWLRHDLGVSKSLWGNACLAMGRELAAVALAIVSTKEEGYFRSGPGGYFHGMIVKAKAGELHLDRTVWALRRAADPERYERGRGGGSFSPRP